MDDQANGLRRLARQERLPLARPQGRPRLLLVTSGKGGAGTTTLSVGLAAMAARQGRRTVLVDAAEHGGDIALSCGTAEPWTVADVLSSRLTAAEALQPGPEGILVLPGAWGQENLQQFTAPARRQLIDQLRSLQPAADCVFVDGGSGSGRALQEWWRAADAVVVVTTPEAASVMDTYASIKLLSAGGDAIPPIYTLVNRATGERVADDVHQRLALSCRRFLGLAVHPAGCVADHHRWFRRGRPADPLALAAGRTGRQLRLAAEVLLAGGDSPARDAGAPWSGAQERLTA